MNGNIEVINENLWAVNGYYLKYGWIKELESLSRLENPEKTSIYLMVEGIIIINSADPEYKVIRRLLTMIMPYPDIQLQSLLEASKRKENPDVYDDLVRKLLQCESDRRVLKEKYIKSQRSLKSRLTRWMRKAVKEWQLYRQV